MKNQPDPHGLDDLDWEAIRKQRTVRLSIAKRSFFWFFHLYMGHYIKHSTADFQKEMMALASDPDVEQLVIMAFRESGKSTIITTALPLWAAIGCLNKKYIVIVSQTQHQAQQHLANIASELENNDLIRKDFWPYDYEENELGVSAIKLPKLGVRIIAVSREQGVRGLRHGPHRPDLVIADDVEDSRTVKSSEGRNRNFAWFTGELRTVNRKNFVFWSDDEVQAFKKKVDDSGIQVVAAATPLFKWYDYEDDPEVEHDNFGFNPRLSNDEKRQTIDKALAIAGQLKIPRLRIFSGLGTEDKPGLTFSRSKLLVYALEEAAKRNIDLYLENEPVCKVHARQDIIDLLGSNKHEHLKLWLDIANLIEIGEDVNPAFIRDVASRLEYIHVKDFVNEDSVKKYVPAGEGIIDYEQIMKCIYEVKKENIIVTVETHAQKNKVESSIASIIGTRNILEAAGVDYE